MTLRRLLIVAALGLLSLSLTSVVGATAASNTVPASRVGEHLAGIAVNDVKPGICAGVTLDVVVTGRGTFAGTSASELLLGAATNDAIDGADGNDCILAGAGDDHLIGGPGTDICIGGPGTNTYDSSCETAKDCMETGSQTVTATRDSGIMQDTPDSTNTGSELKVMSLNLKNERVLLYFPLPTLPTDCSVTTATLRVFRIEGTAGRTIEARQLTGTWTETGVTWNNQPTAAASGATSTSPSGSAWQTWTVTPQVADMYRTANNNGFVLRDQVEDLNELKQVYRSRETTTDRPELVVEW